MTMDMRAPGEYWATIEGVEILPHLVEKIDEYHQYLESSGIRDLWERSHKMYQWGAVANTIGKSGDEEEFDVVVVNHYRNILRHSYVQTVSTRPSFHPRAINTDYKSRTQVRLSAGALQFYVVEKKGESKTHASAETTLVTGEGYQLSKWNPNAGKLVDVEKIPPAEEGGETIERPVYEGDIEVTNPHPLDVIRDVSRSKWEGMPWVIIRERVNRYDLAAIYPEQREEIISASSENSDHWDQRRISLLGDSGREWDSDDVCVYHFVHDRTPSVPWGRCVTFLNGEVMLKEKTLEDLKVQSLHKMLLRISGGEIEGCPFGYTFGFDLMALQDAVNIGHSIALTNLSNFGVTNLTGPAGATAALTRLAKGLNWIGITSVREGKVEALDLLQIPEALLVIIERWEAAMETLSGVNSVARGNPEASLKSGAALALVQSQFLQFSQDYQKSYSQLWEDFGTSLIQLFKHNVPEARLAAIVGKGDRAYLKELKGDDLSNIDRVVVEFGSHLARTAAGRLNLAEQLLAAGFVTTPEQYMAVLETGQLEPLTHAPMAELDLIQAENEALMDGNPAKPLLDQEGQQVLDEFGQPVRVSDARVLSLDDHVLHIKEHKALLCDPQVRRNETATAAVLAHILEHENELLALDPVLGAILGQPSLGPTPPAPGGPAPQGRGSNPAAGQTVNLPATNPVTGQPGQVQMPQSPLEEAA